MNMSFLADTSAVETARSFSVEGPLVVASWNIGGLEINLTESIIIQWFVILIVGTICFFLGRNLKVVPTSRRQMAAEYIVGLFRNMVNDTMGVKYKKYTAYIGALFCFSIISSLMGLLGLRSPTADLSVTATWGIITFVLVFINKIKTGGIKGYVKSYFQPLPFMLPFNIIGDFSNPVSQSLRHFANIVAGMVIGGLVYFALGSFAIGIPAVLSLYFDLFSSFIQAYIFCTLTMAYVSMAETD